MNYNQFKAFKIINANTLKVSAVFFMLFDHLWATIIPGNQWMNYLGRLAFPIFAFQIAEGFIHTGNFKKYAGRLFVFAIIAEIPFNLFYSSSFIYPFHQNTIFTLLLGLLAIRSLDTFRNKPGVKTLFIACFALLATLLAATIGFTDYGATGVLTIVVFYLFRNFPYSWVLQLGAMILLHIVFFSGLYIPLEFFGTVFEFPTQGFAVLSLIPIWLYNGRKGSNHPIFKYLFYTFYPTHLLILYLIFNAR